LRGAGTVKIAPQREFDVAQQPLEPVHICSIPRPGVKGSCELVLSEGCKCKDSRGCWKQLTVVQRLPVKLAFLGITAIASGGYLLWIESAGLGSNWISTGPGITYCVGAIATLLAAIIGFGINIPAANRMGALAAAVHARAEGATSDENQTLGRLAARIRQAPV
jgi:hypothetical protein